MATGALTTEHRLRRTSGQSLMELLVAVGFAILLIGSATSAISLTSTIDKRNKPVQSATFLSQDVLDKITVVAEADWFDNIDALTPGTAYKIVPGCGGGCLAVAAGSESVVVENTTFTRSFAIARVSRDSLGNIVSSGGNDDPSSRQVTAAVSWLEGATNPSVALTKYITRNRNKSTVQTDWSGGSGQSGLDTNSTQFDVASGSVDATGVPGEIRLQ